MIGDHLPDEKTITRWVADFNYVEAVFWMVASFVAWRSSRGMEPAKQKNARLASIALFLFGISDLVETQTGAWWRPWWLLIWKTSCVLALLICWWRHARRNAKP